MPSTLTLTHITAMAIPMDTPCAAMIIVECPNIAPPTPIPISIPMVIGIVTTAGAADGETATGTNGVNITSVKGVNTNTDN